jgi:hypothetical protein
MWLAAGEGHDRQNGSKTPEYERLAPISLIMDSFLPTLAPQVTLALL